MKIAVDAMGGDHAPEAVIEGAILAQPHCGAELVLVGNEARISGLLLRGGEARSMKVVHAPQAIAMGEAGPMAIRRKRESSLLVATRLLAEAEVDAVVSAGNTSAVVAAVKYLIGLLPGLRRPAMAVPLPTYYGKLVLLDAGAYAEAHTIHLAQSAALAGAYLHITEGLDRPRIGLLNIGREPIKGIRVIQRAFTLLNRSSLHFIGNVEPHDLFADLTDAVICDGFVGNVVLKMYEGFSETLSQFLASRAEQYGGGQAGNVLRQALDEFRRSCCYECIGGAPLLGARKTVVVAHGRSRPPAIANAIQLASHFVGKRVYEQMSEELEKDGILTDLKHQNALLMLETLRNKWGFTQK